jgi:hypothetical protein
VLSPGPLLYSAECVGLDFSHLGAKGVGYASRSPHSAGTGNERILPTEKLRVLTPFAPLFSKRVRHHAQVMLVGAILAQGRRTVSSALRAMGMDQGKRFHSYHRVLSRASWSGREVGRVHLGLLVEACIPKGDH